MLGAQERQSRLDSSARWLVHRTRNSAFLQAVTACFTTATAMGMRSEHFIKRRDWAGNGRIISRLIFQDLMPRLLRLGYISVPKGKRNALKQFANGSTRQGKAVK